MKRFVVFLFTIVMMLSLVACGESKANDESIKTNDKRIVITMYYPNEVVTEEIWVDSTSTSSSYNSWSFEGYKEYRTLVVAQSGIVFYKDNIDDEFKTFSGTYFIEIVKE